MYRHVSPVLVSPCLCSTCNAMSLHLCLPSFIGMSKMKCPSSSFCLYRCRMCMLISTFANISMSLSISISTFAHISMSTSISTRRPRMHKDTQRMHKQFTWHLKRHQLLIAPHSSSSLLTAPHRSSSLLMCCILSIIAVLKMLPTTLYYITGTDELVYVQYK